LCALNRIWRRFSVGVISIASETGCTVKQRAGVSQELGCFCDGWFVGGQAKMLALLGCSSG